MFFFILMEQAGIQSLKACFHSQSSFVHKISAVCVITRKEYLLAMGSSGDGSRSGCVRLFVIDGDDGKWRLWTHITRSMVLYPYQSTLWFESCTQQGRLFQVALPIDVAREDCDALPSALVPLPSAGESREEYVVRVGEFWGHLEAFLAMYIYRMKDAVLTPNEFMSCWRNVRWKSAITNNEL